MTASTGNKKKRSSAEHELTSNSPNEPIKPWGFVSAKPSEYLVVYRGGQLAKQLCRQGARLWKWPSDSVAVIPTSLKEVVFHANQITEDQVDVSLRGMLLYRIRDPLRIHKLINFTSRQAAEAKLARMISDMCRSNAKWLVANMKLDECIRRRKEEIAAALKQELALVATESWGVEIETIDIQDVYVQDEELFQAMQARYKAEKHREAELARLDALHDVDKRKIEQARFKAEKERDAQLATLDAQHQVDKRRIAHELAAARERQQLQLEQVERAGQVQLAELAQRRRQEEGQYEIDNFRVDQEAEIALRKAQQEQERERVAADGERERAAIRTEAQRMAQEAEVRYLREKIAAESSAGRAYLDQIYLREALPVMAQALSSGLDGARISLLYGNGGQDSLRGLIDTLLLAAHERLGQAPTAPTSSGSPPSA